MQKKVPSPTGPISHEAVALTDDFPAFLTITAYESLD